MKTLEQVIMDIAAHNWSSFVDKEEEAVTIAEAVRGWMREQNEGLRDTIYNLLMNNLPPQALSLEDCRKYTDAILSVIPPRRVQSAPDRARIKELEAEVARLEDLAAKYDELRAKFPFLPGENFWTLFQESVCKWTVEKIWFNDDGRLCLTGYRERANGSILESPRYKASECHLTADACRAAIPVEE